MGRKSAMLTLTENASTIVKTLVDQNLPGDDSGLRFSQEGAESGGLTVTTAESGQPGDALVEQDGAKVYLDETAAVALADQVLDASVDEQGSVQFAIAPAGGAGDLGAQNGAPTA
jgi:Fe-S cluster assembly iron-binding protein IscA